MKTVKIGEFSARLVSQFGEYNCGNKTCGRLTIEALKEGDTTNYGAANIEKELEQESIRDEIVKNFLADIDKSTAYSSLNTGAGQYFPTDTGHYRPGVLMYADRVAMGKHIKWYNNWKGLIELFETEPKFEVRVFKSPILPNVFYGTSAPSRMWIIALPTVSKHICYDKEHVTNEMRTNLVAVRKHYGSPVLNQELEQLGITA